MTVPPDLPTWDETTRPHRDAAAYAGATPSQRLQGEHLRMIHEMYRDGLERVGEVVRAVAQGEAEVGQARAALHDVGLTEAYQRLGSFCGQLCRAVEVHHRIEDAHLYPALRAADPEGLHDVLDRLVDEHDVVHALLERLDGALVDLARGQAPVGEVRVVFEHLRILLESHFAYEEQQIGLPLGVHGIMV